MRDVAADLKTVAWSGLAASLASPACFLAGAGGMITMALMFATAPWMIRQRIAGYASLAGRVHQTVSAIHAFEAANGRAPQSSLRRLTEHLHGEPLECGRRRDRVWR